MPTTPHNLTLADLSLGQTGTVIKLDNQGPERRRMMDLGLIPGTVVEVAMHSPLGDPTAYRVRGTLVALRRVQAAHIRIQIAAHEVPHDHD